MGRLELRYDHRRRQFFADAVAALPEPGGHPPAEVSGWLVLEMIVDTGAYRSTLSSQTARFLGVPVENLPRRTVEGATGVAMVPTLPSVYLAIGDGLPTMLPIDEVGVLGGRAGLNLLGMDVLEGLGARLFLDVAVGRGRLEWP